MNTNLLETCRGFK